MKVCEIILCFEEVKLIHRNWHRKIELKTLKGAHSIKANYCAWEIVVPKVVLNGYPICCSSQLTNLLSNKNP